MNIVVIGSGYVGLVTAACLAESGNSVTCIDLDKSKLNMLRQGKIPFYEKDLKEIVLKTTSEKKLKFTNSYKNAFKGVKAIFLCVGTPPKSNGEPDLKYIKSSLTSISEFLSNDVIIFIKSTVPVGTNQFANNFISTKLKNRIKVHLASNPEFLKEGTAVEDFKKPDRVIIGTEDDEVKKISKKIYKSFITTNKIVFTTIESAEIIKYASNAFLATKIAFINEIARLSDHFEANIDEIKNGMALDKRIGEHFLNSGLGFGGSCFPKDLDGLIDRYSQNGIPSLIPAAVRSSNEQQIRYFSEKISANLKNKNSHLMLWGLAFKGNTDDVRESPSIKLLKLISKKYKKIYAYDPLAMSNAKKILSSYKNIQYIKNKYDFIEKCDCLIIATEHEEFCSIDFNEMNKIRSKVIFDGRNILDKDQLKIQNFEYFGVGKKIFKS